MFLVTNVPTKSSQNILKLFGPFKNMSLFMKKQLHILFGELLKNSGFGLLLIPTAGITGLISKVQVYNALMLVTEKTI